MEFLIISWVSMCIIVLIAGFVLGKPSKMSKMPPGPAPLPIIGNLHLISRLPHRSFCSLAQKYGPIMTLHLGSLPTVIISSPQMAKQILKTQDHVFASRPPMGSDDHFLSPQKVAFAPYGPYWKFMRKVLVLELLSPKRLKSFAPLRAQEVSAMIRSILHKARDNDNSSSNSSAVDLSMEVGFLTNNIICRMCFGKICNDDEMGGRVFKEVLDEVLALAGGFKYSDYIPLLGWVDLQGNRRRQAKLTKIFHLFVDKIVDEHLERRKKFSGLECEDFVDLLLSLSENESMEIKITRDHIKNVIFDSLSAATDTSGGTLEWAMSELLRNSSSLKKAQCELDSIIGFNRMVEEYDLPHLHYLQSVVKETLRLHPSVPMLLPHQSMEQSTLEGYQIPKNTQVIVNAWAIGRDPITWEEANEFKPERYLGTQIDVKGQSFELIPFGSGRRGCPGIDLALSVVHLGLAQLLHCFSWSLPHSVTPKKLDMSETYGITIPRAIHLHAIPIPRLPLEFYEPKA
ncbi:cytochrome P450 71AU50 isoform X1 [Cryptomeria japonica]|uniref:cytochrome P450 71AU50 isoform X1 n=2 Tax=Cryptomeria japonica TaxID=3369 RepID=UPI0027DA374B|nr:cytochrome P450 71AU50 isoform X1 [Cryptomeria japonica]